jgi:hypothetical protein
MKRPSRIGASGSRPHGSPSGRVEKEQQACGHPTPHRHTAPPSVARRAYITQTTARLVACLTPSERARQPVPSVASPGDSPSPRRADARGGSPSSRPWKQGTARAYPVLLPGAPGRRRYPSAPSDAPCRSCSLVPARGPAWSRARRIHKRFSPAWSSGNDETL